MFWNPQWPQTLLFLVLCMVDGVKPTMALDHIVFSTLYVWLMVRKPWWSETILYLALCMVYCPRPYSHLVPGVADGAELLMV